MIYGYARISTKKQNIERQVRNIIAAYPDSKDHIYQEAYTGTTTDRPKFDKLKSKVAKGDTIIFDSVSRMSRNAMEGYNDYMRFYDDGVNLVFLKEPQINTSVYRDAMSKRLSDILPSGDPKKKEDKLIKGIIDALSEYMIDIAKEQIMLAFEQAQKEVDDLHQRTREGIETAKRKGKKVGGAGHKSSTMVTKKSVKMKNVIRKYSKSFDGDMSDKELLEDWKIARNTFYKYKKELSEEIVKSGQ